MVCFHGFCTMLSGCDSRCFFRNDAKSLLALVGSAKPGHEGVMYIAKVHDPALAAGLTLGSAALAAATTLLAKALGTGVLGHRCMPCRSAMGDSPLPF
jgi:hypothetical protein